MTYRLKFLPLAFKEWKKLDSSMQKEFKKKLSKRLIQPKVPSAKLLGQKDIYKIKLKSSGYRLVYKVIDNELCVMVVVIGKREKNSVYNKMNDRLK